MMWLNHTTNRAAFAARTVFTQTNASSRNKP
ncbi:hypothetical protein VAA_02279 [Vibrio anguillarum 775]|nr:hypothetical protein VAA_02279 [Vibrio anguillarum 775]